MLDALISDITADAQRADGTRQPAGITIGGIGNVNIVAGQVHLADVPKPSGSKAR